MPALSIFSSDLMYLSYSFVEPEAALAASSSFLFNRANASDTLSKSFADTCPSLNLSKKSRDVPNVSLVLELKLSKRFFSSSNEEA